MQRSITSVSRITYLIVTTLLTSCAVDAPLLNRPVLPRSHHGKAVAFLSDTQEPLWIETLHLKTDRNTDATSAIFEGILADTSITSVFHLGDITAVGSLPSEWERMDEGFTAFQSAGIRVFAVPGNHEYYLTPGSGMQEFRRRFPRNTTTWISRRAGSLGVILLNTNFSHLSSGEREEQRRWFENEIARLDRDSTIQCVVVGSHHSPYTNSTIVEPSSEARMDFLPSFFQSKKCRLYVSGHSHACEHFRVQGKDFLVIGGGGGLLHPLRTGPESRDTDLFPEQTTRRRFNFLKAEDRGSTWCFSVLMLNNDYRTFTRKDSVSIKIGE